MRNMTRSNDDFVRALGADEVPPPTSSGDNYPAAAGSFQNSVVEYKGDDAIQNPAAAGFLPGREYISLETQKKFLNTGRAIGQYDGLNFARQVMTVAQIAKLIEIRESRIYKQAGYSNWENFCREMLGVNVEVIDEQIRNFKKFGPAFLEAATRVSLSRTVFRKLRALPDAEIQEMVSGTVVRIEGEEIPLDEEHGPEINTAIETLLARRRQETEKLRKQNGVAAKKLLEKDTKIARQDEQIEVLKKTVEEIRGRDETYLEIQERILQVYGRTLVQMQTLYQALQDIVDPGTRERLCAMMIPELERKLQAITGVIVGYDLPGGEG